MTDSWVEVWQQLRDALKQQPRCADHPEFPCIRTLRRSSINDIIRIDKEGVTVRSHRTHRADDIPASTFEVWWNRLQRDGRVSIDPNDPNTPRSDRAVLVAAIIATCLDNRVEYAGSGEIHLISEAKNQDTAKDPWGSHIGSGAAAINKVLLEADSPLTEEQIIARVREQGLKERIC